MAWLTVTLFGVPSAGAQWAEVVGDGDWYQAAPLLASLRSGQRSGLARSAGVDALEDLTLYDVDTSVDPSSREFWVQERIYWTNDTGQHLSEIVLRVYSNAVGGRPATQLQAAHCVGLICETAVESPTALVVRPIIPIPPRGRLTIELRLAGTLRHIDSSRTNMMAQGMEGLGSLLSAGNSGNQASALGATEHSGGYGLLAIGDGIASLANFYAVVARRENGQWVRREATSMGDLGPDAMAHVRSRIRVPAGFQVATTGVISGQRSRQGGQEFEVLAGAVRDYSFLVSRDFRTAERQVGDVVVRSYFLARDQRSGQRVLDIAAESLAIFERRFGAYPYRDLDVVEAALVGGAGGVEFAGLVTVASMLYRPTPSMGRLSESMLEFVTAHEVAHQYWHGLVGSDSRAHPFVDESLAQYSAMLYLEERYGQARMEQDANQQVRGNYHMMRMMGIADGPVHRPVDAFRSPVEYAGLVYGKGAYLYPALRSALGDSAFFRGLRDYVSTYRFNTAPGRGLVDHLAATGQRAQVTPIARRWLEETHGDEDLGTPTLASMMESVLGGDGTSPSEMQDLLRQLQPQLGLDQGGTSQEQSLQDLQRLLGQQGDILRVIEGLLPQESGR